MKMQRSAPQKRPQMHPAERANAGSEVLLALSGGVDSAACVRLLQRQGYTVQGLVIRFSEAHDSTVQAAQLAAGELGIPLTVAHCEEAFRQNVILPFCQEYAAGRTPNPCVVCNPLVKFHTLAAKADRLGIHHIATGHYARVVERNGIFHVARAASAARDQSYMLYRLPQSILQRLLLPAGELEKQEIRGIAAAENLSSADAPDSQEICFIPDGDYAAYIKAQGFAGPAGRFIGPDGQDLGPHQGLLHYTVGQRKGLGVALGQPVFVRSIESWGDIRLAYANGTYARSILLTDLIPAIDSIMPMDTVGLTVKIRSMAKPVSCRAEPTDDGQLRVIFDEPQRSPAPGQHAVLYHGEVVAGGGVIASTEYDDVPREEPVK